MEGYRWWSYVGKQFVVHLVLLDTTDFFADARNGTRSPRTSRRERKRQDQLIEWSRLKARSPRCQVLSSPQLIDMMLPELEADSPPTVVSQQAAGLSVVRPNSTPLTGVVESRRAGLFIHAEV